MELASAGNRLRSDQVWGLFRWPGGEQQQSPGDELASRSNILVLVRLRTFSSGGTSATHVLLIGWLLRRAVLEFEQIWSTKRRGQQCSFFYLVRQNDLFPGVDLQRIPSRGWLKLGMTVGKGGSPTAAFRANRVGTSQPFRPAIPITAPVLRDVDLVEWRAGLHLSTMHA